jgi:putative ABC transport system substrate-binding protein
MSHLERRIFVQLLSAAAGWPVVGSLAQAQHDKLWKIGVLTPANPEPLRTVLRQALRDLGYVVGHNTRLEFRSADGEPARLPELAAELIRLNVDVIIASQTPAVQALHDITKEIPIIMAGAGDPVAVGLVASLARPGGNITGLSATTAEIGGKLLEGLREIVPATKRVAIMANAADPFTRTFLEQLERPAQIMGLQIQRLSIGGVSDLPGAYSEMVAARADAVVVQPSLPRQPAIDLALKHRLPAASPLRLFTEAGGLMSYASNSTDIWRRGAQFVDKILKGAKPADLPVEQPVRFELIINLKTAKALGLEISPMLLARADEVIE